MPIAPLSQTPPEGEPLCRMLTGNDSLFCYSLNISLNCYLSDKKVPFYISGYRIAGGLLWSPRITTGQRYLDEPHSLVKIIDGIELKA